MERSSVACRPQAEGLQTLVLFCNLLLTAGRFVHSTLGLHRGTLCTNLKLRVKGT